MERKQSQIAIFSEPDFLRAYVREGLLMLDGSVPDREVTLRMHEEDVAEYRSGDVAIIAKVYADRADSDHTWAVLTALAADGLGPESPYRVPRPLLRTPDGGIILMEAARGVPMLPMLDNVAFVTGCRRMGEWLAYLHASPARVGIPLDSSEALDELRQDITAAEERGVSVGEYRDIQTSIVRALALADGVERVQTHGRFHPGHAFIGPETVTMIDLDRSAPRHPAVDVAIFLYRLRTMWLKGGLDDGALAEAEAAFLGSYGPTPPTTDVYLAAAWLGAVLRTLSKRRTDPTERTRRLQFYETQLRRAVAAK